MLLIVQMTYHGIEAVHDIRYDYGIPAMAASSLILLFGRLDHQYIAPVKKAFQVILFIAAFQFLDIMHIAGNLPNGRGETSMDIKMAAALLGAEMLLDVIGVAG